MGASASVQQLYSTSVDWFRKYFDEEMYVTDFHSIDKDQNGGIAFRELETWIKLKAQKEGSTSAWSFMLTSPEVMTVAHTQAGKHRPDLTIFPNQKVVDITDFRNLLVHLFAISILWVHFKNADEWREGNDFGNLTLSLEEFKLACRSMAAAHAMEELTDEQITKDFEMLDTNKNQSLAFLEVCDFCCQFISGHAPKPGLAGIHKGNNNDTELLLGRSTDATAGVAPTTSEEEVIKDVDYEDDGEETPRDPMADLRRELKAKSMLKPTLEFHTLDKKNEVAIADLRGQIQRNKSVAEFVEVKVTTENEIKAIMGNM